MAEAVVVSLSAKVAMAVARSTALGVVTSLGGVHSSIAAAEHELSLLRGHLRSGRASCRGADDDDDPIDSWANQVRDVAFQLDDITDECCFLSGSGSGHGFARYCANVPTWIALSRRLRKVREKLGQLLEAANQRQRIDVSSGEVRREDDDANAIAAGRRMAENARFMDKEEIIGFSDHREVLARWLAAPPADDTGRRVRDGRRRQDDPRRQRLQGGDGGESPLRLRLVGHRLAALHDGGPPDEDPQEVEPERRRPSCW